MALSGFAAGAGMDALQEFLAQKVMEQRLQQQAAQQEAQQREQREMERARLAETVRSNRFNEGRVRRADQLAEAEGVVSALDAGFDPESAIDADVSAADAATLAGTPQGARVRRIMNLRARPIDPSMAATMSQTPTVVAQRLSPTGPQQAERRKIVNLRRRAEDFTRLRNAPNTPEKVRTLMDLQQAGMDAAPIGSSLLETPADRQADDDRAFGNFERRSRLTDTLVRGRQPAREDPARVRDRERREALRAARRDAIAEYNARKDRDTGPTVDLDTLIEEYEEEVTSVLDALEAAETGDAGGAGAPVATPGAGRPTTAPSGPRRIIGLSPIPSHGGAPAGRGPQPTEPRLREQRVVNGQLAEWDGRGWLPVPQ